MNTCVCVCICFISIFFFTTNTFIWFFCFILCMYSTIIYFMSVSPLFIIFKHTRHSYTFTCIHICMTPFYYTWKINLLQDKEKSLKTVSHFLYLHAHVGAYNEQPKMQYHDCNVNGNDNDGDDDDDDDGKQRQRIRLRKIPHHTRQLKIVCLSCALCQVL